MARRVNRRQGIGIGLGLLLVAAALWLQHSGQEPVRDLRERVEGMAYDLRFSVIRPFGADDTNVVIVDIDERSLRQEGRWPWPRARTAELVERLFEYGAVVVGLDIVFAEPERNPARDLRRQLAGVAEDEHAELRSILERIAPEVDGDRRFADTLADRDAVLGYMLTHSSGTAGRLGPPLEGPGVPHPAGTAIRDMQGFIGNVEPLSAQAPGAGFFTTLPDPDGTIRRYHLILAHDGAIYPSLALAMARQYLLAEEMRIATTPVGAREAVDELRFAGLGVPTDGEGAVLVPYHGTAGSFPYVSAADVLAGDIPAEQLSGRLVLVGTTAEGLYDLRSTPLQAVYPGVEVHANVLQGLLDERFPARPNWAEGANFALLLLIGLVLATALPLLRPLPLTLATLGAAGLLVAGNTFAWTQLHWVLPLAIPLMLVLGLGGLNMAHGYLFEARSRRELKRMFGQYVPPELVEDIADDPASAASLAGERRDMTVLFADIRGFTTLSEKLPPAEIKDLLNRYFTPMTRVIFEHRGTIDKYVGDQIMAFWGAPQTDPDHARHAVAAALAMRAAARELAEALEADGLPRVEIGIGLNTGPMNVGNMGSAYRRSYTVLGDAVNVGARVEGLTRDYGVDIVVSESVRDRLAEIFLFRPLDWVQVKGRAAPVTVYEPLCAMEAASSALRDQVATHEATFRAWLDGDPAGARSGFEALAKAEPADPVYRLFLERLRNAGTAVTGPVRDQGS